MVATPLSVNTIGRGGITPVTEAAGDNTNGNSVPNNGSTWLEVSNSAGSSGTVTVAYANQVDGQVVPARSYTIPATTGKKRIGPFPVALFGATLIVTPSAATITIAAYQLGS